MPVALPVIALVVLLVNLLAAGSTSFPGVFLTAWLLVPVALARADAPAWTWPLHRPAGLALLGGCDGPALRLRANRGLARADCWPQAIARQRRPPQRPPRSSRTGTAGRGSGRSLVAGALADPGRSPACKSTHKPAGPTTSTASPPLPKSFAAAIHNTTGSSRPAATGCCWPGEKAAGKSTLMLPSKHIAALHAASRAGPCTRLSLPGPCTWRENQMKPPLPLRRSPAAGCPKPAWRAKASPAKNLFDPQLGPDPVQPFPPENAEQTLRRLRSNQRPGEIAMKPTLFALVALGIGIAIGLVITRQEFAARDAASAPAPAPVDAPAGPATARAPSWSSSTASGTTSAR